MKRLISGLLFLCSLCVSAQTYTYDVNNDGNVNMADLAFFVNYLKSYTGSGTPDYDVNGDGTADLDDITCLKNHILGLLNEGEHEYVDLGLSVKWATCNIGADNPEDYGLYFAWGDTVGYASNVTHIFATPKWYDSTKGYIKYCTNGNYGTVDNLTTLELADDAANHHWGGAWRMPTYDEMQELYENCTWAIEKLNGKRGYRATSKINGNSIFLPATGYRDTSTHAAGSSGSYWSSSLYTDYSADSAHSLSFSNIGFHWSDYRFYGQSIRAVCK